MSCNPHSRSSLQVNGLLMPSVSPHPSTLSLLNPFINLTAVFATTLTAPEPIQNFPNALQELHLTAGTKGQV